jgi:GNAT superfamily N-acetyltransferase
MLTIRPAVAPDEERLGRYGGALLHQHHAADARRFIDVENPEPGYGRFLVSQAGKPTSAVLVADDDGTVVGYVYATIEDTNWMELRGPCGVIQDIYVDQAKRRAGAGRGLLQAAIDWIRSHGRTQVVLHTKTRNESAHHLFTAFGFRPTMVELTWDEEPTGGKRDA